MGHDVHINRTEETEMTSTMTYRLDSIELSDLHATDLRREAVRLLRGDARGDAADREEIAEILESESTQEPFRQYPALAYRLVVEGKPEAADVLVATETGQVGIAWGADADWIDLHDLCDLTTVEGGDQYMVALEQAIGVWLEVGR